MTTLIDYNQCKLCNSYVYKKYFNNHLRECSQKNIEKYNNIMNKYKNYNTNLIVNTNLKVNKDEQIKKNDSNDNKSKEHDIKITKDDNPKDDNPKDDNPKDDNPKDDKPKDDKYKDDKPKDDKYKDDKHKDKHKKDDKHKKEKDYQLKEYVPQSLVSYNDINQVLKKYDSLFTEYVSGKCVALIGPAESILNTNKGDIIDKFDIIVRLNKSIPLPEGLEHDIGSRTDIIYNSLNTTDYPGQNRFGTKLYKKHGIKFVSSSYPFNNPIFKQDILNYINKYNFELPFKTFDDNKFRNLEKYLGTRPYTGTCAIFDLLSYPIKYLYISGLDFYHSKYYKEYREITKGQQKYSRDSNIHQAKPQLNYLKNISLFDNRIILDSFLDTLLYSNYYNFYKELKKVEQNIFNYGDPIIEKLFSIKKFNCVFTKGTSLSFTNTNNELNMSTIIFTNNYYFNNKSNEYLLFISSNKDEMNILNNNMEKKRFIGNFYYVEHHSKELPSIFLNRNYLNFIKNILKHINIVNCNTYLLLILSIMLYFPENHYFSYKEVLENFGLNMEEKKLVLFLHKKNKLKLIS